MSEHFSIDRQRDESRDEASIRDLIRVAGRRPEPAAFRTARVRAAVEAEWRRSRPRRFRWWSMAAAAVVVVALVLWARVSLRHPAPPATLPAFATLVRVTGDVTLTSNGSAPRAVANGERVKPAVTLDTSAGGRVALMFDSGASIRLDRGSRIVLEATNRLRLERGRVYADSDAVTPGGGLQIATRSGVVRDIGTQFEIDASQAFVQIRVRDGAVRIEQTNASIDVAEAELVRIGADGAVERKSIARFGPEWSWITSIAPPFALEGATLESFLQWVTREQGWEWRFSDDAAARHGKGVVLHGTIEGLTPAEALDAVLATCNMTYELRDAQLFVGLAAREERK